jgi:hypothetical protein
MTCKVFTLFTLWLLPSRVKGELIFTLFTLSPIGEGKRVKAGVKT